MNLTFQGGINEKDETQVDPAECVSGYNFELGSRDTHLKPRKAFDLLGTATNAGEIRGIVQNITASDSVTTLIQSGATMYDWDGGSTFTSKGSVNAGSRMRGSQWTLDGYSVLTDLDQLTVMKKWDGATLSSLTTGLGTSLYAKYSIVHLGRVFLFNVKAGAITPHLIVASAFENPESYDTAKRSKDVTFSSGNEAFFFTMPDGRPINGVALFFDTVVISTKEGRLWKITGSDSTDFAIEPYYAGSAATGTEAMVNVGNDIQFMRTGGVIEALSTTEQFGDVSTDDISRWIETTVDGLSEAIAIYDQQRQKVYYFTEANKLLVYFKDMSQSTLSPWSIYKTDHASSFDTRAALYMRAPGSTDYYVYYGDDSGNVYRLDGGSAGDPSSTDINTRRRSTTFDELNTEFERIRGKVEYHRAGDVELLMDFEWTDDYAINRCLVKLEGPPVNDSENYFGGDTYFGGTFYWNEGFSFIRRISTKNFSPVGRGPGFNLELTVITSSDFDIIRIRI